LWAFKQARMTLYAITENRALILSRTIRGVSIQSFLPVQLTNLQTRKRSDGSGGIVFGGSSPPIQNISKPNSSMPAGFYCIKNVSVVEKMLLDLNSKSEDIPPA